jgi:hypothetical protein
MTPLTRPGRCVMQVVDKNSFPCRGRFEGELRVLAASGEGGGAAPTDVFFYDTDPEVHREVRFPPPGRHGGLHIAGPAGRYSLQVVSTGGALPLRPSNRVGLELEAGAPHSLRVADAFPPCALGERIGGQRLKVEDVGGNGIDLGGYKAAVAVEGVSGLALTPIPINANANTGRAVLPPFFVCGLDFSPPHRPALQIALELQKKGNSKGAVRGGGRASGAETVTVTGRVPSLDLNVNLDSAVEQVRLVTVPAQLGVGRVAAGAGLDFRAEVKLARGEWQPAAAVGRIKVTYTVERPTPLVAITGFAPAPLPDGDGSYLRCGGEQMRTSGNYKVRALVAWALEPPSQPQPPPLVAPAELNVPVMPGDLAHLRLDPAPQPPLRVDNTANRELLKGHVECVDAFGNRVVLPHPVIITPTLESEAEGGDEGQPRAWPLEGAAPSVVQPGQNRAPFSMRIGDQADTPSGGYKLVFQASGTGGAPLPLPTAVPRLEVAVTFTNTLRQEQADELLRQLHAERKTVQNCQERADYVRRDQGPVRGQIRDKLHAIRQLAEAHPGDWGEGVLARVLAGIDGGDVPALIQELERARRREQQAQRVLRPNARSGLDGEETRRIEGAVGGRGANNFLGTLAELGRVHDDHEARAIAGAFKKLMSTIVVATSEQYEAVTTLRDRGLDRGGIRDGPVTSLQRTSAARNGGRVEPLPRSV